MSNCNFINSAANNGGGLDWDGANGTISCSTFIGNTANSAGGGLGVSSNAINLNLINCAFKNNSATWNGAINLVGANSIISSSTFIGNTVKNSAGGVAVALLIVL